MLKRIYIDNYRCFVNFDWRPQPVQLLIGRNGTGKSTLFQVLRTLRDFSVRGGVTDEHFLGETVTRWQSIPEQTFRLFIDGPSARYEYRLSIGPVGPSNRPRVLMEEVLFDGNHVFRFEDGTIQLYNDSFKMKAEFGGDWHRSGLATVVARPENTKLMWFKDWMSRVLCVQVDPKRMSSRAEREASVLDSDCSNFAAWYRHLLQERSGDVSEFRGTLVDVIDEFDSLDAREAGQNVRILRANFRGEGKLGQKPSIFACAFDELSDGQRALIALYALKQFCLSKDSLLCIDEPDNFVALGEIQPWLTGLLDKAEDEGTQMLLASHHPELLNQLAFDQGVTFDRVSGRHVVASPFQGTCGTEIPPSEQVARGWHNE